MNFVCYARVLDYSYRRLRNLKFNTVQKFVGKPDSDNDTLAAYDFLSLMQ